MARILIVEDNEISRDILMRRLKRFGHEILVAADGPEALARAENDRPDLILMDMTLPGMDGWDTTRELRRHHETEQIPVIALTAHTLPSDRARALEAGCDEFEPKPVEFDGLMRKIETLLTHGRDPLTGTNPGT